MTTNEQAGENPYLGRRGYLEAHAHYVTAARAWRLTGVLALLVAALSSAAMVMMATQSQVIPYVVRVDKLGTAIPVDRADIAEKPDRAVITAQLARWVTAARSVWVDAGAQRGLVKEAYAMINARADSFGQFNDYMRANDPFQRAQTETVSVDVRSILPISADSWRLEWREDARRRDGQQIASREYTATVTVAFNPPRDEATIRINPMGLYINSFAWAERLAAR